MRTIKSMATGLLIMSAVATNASEPENRTWVDVTLETPGSLGVEILYKVDKLSDVKHLRVNGPINSDDWATMKNLSTIESLDLSKTNATTMPQSQFNNASTLSYILLPSSLTSIGNQALKNTSIAEITIPASVKTIGSECFQQCKSLTTVTFDANSCLTSLGENSFYECSALTGIAIPDGVTTIAKHTFYRCTSLSDVRLSANITSIGSNAFRYNSALQLISLPETLHSISEYAFSESGLTAAEIPTQVNSMGGYCFGNCKNLTDITLPAGVHVYDDQFRDCTKLTRITCRTATPPAMNTQWSDPFYGCNKSNVALSVPEFAIVNFKLHSYWLQFGKIEGGVTSTYWDINESLALTNNRRMEGTPSINLTSGAQLTVGGNAPMTVNELTIATECDNYSNPTFGQLINNSPSMTARNITTGYTLRENRWYFISMPYDVNVKDITHSTANAAFIFRYYDGAARAAKGTGYSWQTVDENGILKAGQGYIMQTNTRGTIYLPASTEGHTQIFNPNARTIALEANASETSANAGWNYLGNPFTSYYDMYYTMLTCPVTVWDMSNNNYTAYSLIDDNVVLKPNQSFFIQAADGLSSVEFGTLGRQFTSEVSRIAAAPAFGTQTTNRYLFNLTLDFNGHTDASRVVLNEDASLGYEASCDAAKFFSDAADIAHIYTIDSEGNQLAINERPESDATVKVGIYAPAGGHMSITAGRIDGEAILHDALTGSNIVLSEGTVYDFNATEAGYIDNRFTLTVRKPRPSGIDSIDAENTVTVTAATGTIRIEGATGMTLNIYTIDGRQALNQKITSNEFTASMPAGMYIVNVGNTSTKCIVK